MDASNYWVFANKPEGTYRGKIWDMYWILNNRRFPLEKDVHGYSRLKVGDVVYIRIYGQSYIGRFVVGEWQACPEIEPTLEGVGTYEMVDFDLWPRPVPQERVLGSLSNRDVRSRLIKITRDDALLIEAARSR